MFKYEILPVLPSVSFKNPLILIMHVNILIFLVMKTGDKKRNIEYLPAEEMEIIVQGFSGLLKTSGLVLTHHLQTFGTGLII